MVRLPTRRCLLTCRKNCRGFLHHCLMNRPQADSNVDFLISDTRGISRWLEYEVPLTDFLTVFPLDVVLEVRINSESSFRLMAEKTLILEVFGWLEPLDLLHLSRTNKLLRKFLRQ